MFNRSSFIPQWVADLKKRKMLEVNDAALEFWGMTHEQFLSSDFNKFFHEDEMPRWEVFIKDDRWGESGPWKCTRGDGTVFYCTTRWQMIDYDGSECAFVFPILAGDSPSNMVELARCSQQLSSSK